MSVMQKIAVGVFVAIFIAAKIFFFLSPAKSFAVAAIPAFLLILSSAQSTSAQDTR